MKKLNLGIAAAPKTARSAHPIVQADEETKQLLGQFVVVNPQFKTLKNQSETLGKQLAPRIKALFFNRFAGVEPESSTMLVQVGDKTIKLTVKNAYSKQATNEADLVAAIGQKLTDKYFYQSTVLNVDLDKVPDEAQQEKFAEAVIALAQSMGLADDVVTASQFIKPRAGFHEARTSILTPAQNLALDNALPVVAYPQL